MSKKNILLLVSVIMILSSCKPKANNIKDSFSYSPPPSEEINEVSYSFIDNVNHIKNLSKQGNDFANLTSKAIYEAFIEDEYYYQNVKTIESEYSKIIDENNNPKEGYFENNKIYTLERNNEDYSISTPKGEEIKINNISYERNENNELIKKEINSKTSYKLYLSDDHKKYLETYIDLDKEEVTTKKHFFDYDEYLEKLNLINTDTLFDLFDAELTFIYSNDELSLKKDNSRDYLCSNYSSPIYDGNGEIDKEKNQGGEIEFYFIKNYSNEDSSIYLKVSYSFALGINGLKYQQFKKEYYDSMPGASGNGEEPFYQKLIKKEIN